MLPGGDCKRSDRPLIRPFARVCRYAERVNAKVAEEKSVLTRSGLPEENLTHKTNPREYHTEQAFQLYQEKLKRFLARFTDSHSAEDILQELWRFVYLRFTIDQMTSLPLLKRKAYQLFVDCYRKRQRYRKACETIWNEAGSDELVREEAFVSDEDLEKRFCEAFPVDGLTKQQKKLVFLMARNGWSYNEAESETGVPASTACDWVARARLELSRYRDSPEA